MPRALTTMLTYNNSIKRHLLCIFPIVIKGQVPDARIQILDKPSFMKADGPRLSTRSLRLEQSALLPCDQPAAIQELHKVVLQGTEGSMTYSDAQAYSNGFLGTG